MNSPETFFGGAPEAFASAPGRVNLLGEHTDYNDGYMLPVATPQVTSVALARSIDAQHHLYSGTLDGNVTFAARGGSAPQGFGSYVEGCIRLVEALGVAVPALRLYVTTDLPVGSGLSSSAALEVATLRALRQLLGFELDDVRLAQIAQRAEIEYARVNCGIMDQMASSLCDERSMLFIDARTLEHRLVPLPPDTELIVVDSGVPRTLAASKYNERRAECEEASRKLGVRALRDRPGAGGNPAGSAAPPRPPRGAGKRARAGSGAGRAGRTLRRTDERVARQPARRLRGIDSRARPAGGRAARCPGRARRTPDGGGIRRGHGCTVPRRLGP
jgi:galactokinase